MPRRFVNQPFPWAFATHQGRGRTEGWATLGARRSNGGEAAGGALNRLVVYEESLVYGWGGSTCARYRAVKPAAQQSETSSVKGSAAKGESEPTDDFVLVRSPVEG